MLPEVTITGKRTPPGKYRMAKEKVKLYPQGEVDKSSVDSLKRIGYGKAVGEPMRMKGQMDMYGEASSDNIKRLMKNGSKTL